MIQSDELDKAVSACMKDIENLDLIYQIRTLLKHLEYFATTKMEKIKSAYGYSTRAHKNLPDLFKNKKNYTYYYDLIQDCIDLRIDVYNGYQQLITLKRDILSANELEQKQIDSFLYFLYTLKTFIELFFYMERVLGLRHPLFRLQFIVLRKRFESLEKPLIQIKEKIAMPFHETLDQTMHANSRVIPTKPSPIRPFHPFTNRPVALNFTPARSVTYNMRRAPRANHTVVHLQGIRSKSRSMRASKSMTKSMTKSASKSMKKSDSNHKPISNETLIKVIERFSIFSKRMIRMKVMLVKIQQEYKRMDTRSYKKNREKTLNQYNWRPYSVVREKAIGKVIDRIDALSEWSSNTEPEATLLSMEKVYVALSDSLQPLFDPWIKRSNSMNRVANKHTSLPGIERYILESFSDLQAAFIKLLGKSYVELHFPLPILHVVKTNL